MTVRYKHLWKKIALVRRSLRLDQETLAAKLSTEKHSIKRTAVARWEAKDERNRSTPSDEQISALAKLTGDPKFYLSWMIDDSVSADTYVAYTDDGKIEEFHDLDFSEHELDEIEAHRERNEAEYNARVAAPARGVLYQALEDPSAIEALRRQLADEWRQKRPAGLDAVAMIVDRKAKEQAAQENENFLKRVRYFQLAVRHVCLSEIDDVDFDKTIKLGSLTVKADYFDGHTLIQFVSHWSTSENPLPRLKEKLGDMFLFEKVAQKNPKKLLIIVTNDPTPTANPTLQGDIANLRTIGIRLLVTTPEQTEAVGRAILTFIKARASEAMDTQLIQYVIGPKEH
jgi:hypothetical protein